MNGERLTSLGLDATMSLDDAFLLGYGNGEADEHSRWSVAGPTHHHNRAALTEAPPSESLDEAWEAAEKATRIVEAAVAAVTWRNKVPTPGTVDPWNVELDRRDDELAEAVMEYLGQERWWAETYAPDGWPEPLP